MCPVDRWSAFVQFLCRVDGGEQSGGDESPAKEVVTSIVPMRKAQSDRRNAGIVSFASDECCPVERSAAVAFAIIDRTRSSPIARHVSGCRCDSMTEHKP